MLSAVFQRNVSRKEAYHRWQPFQSAVAVDTSAERLPPQVCSQTAEIQETTHHGTDLAAVKSFAFGRVTESVRERPWKANRLAAAYAQSPSSVLAWSQVSCPCW